MTSLTEKPPVTQPSTPYNDLLFNSTHDDESSSKNYTLDKKTEVGSQQLLVDTPPPLSEEEIKALYRKLDFRMMPILALLYFCAQLDRGNIGNAAIEGLTKDLHLTGNRYNIALTMFFIIIWGVVMTMMGLVKNYHQLVGVRACLGVAEAGLFPGVVYYLTFWYPRHQLSRRIGYFFAPASIAGAFSGLLAYAISFMEGIQGLHAWQWIFILEGIATVAAGLLAALLLYDVPATAGYLKPHERAYIVWRQKYAYSEQGEDETFSWQYVKDAICDWQVYTHVIVYMSANGPLYGILFYAPTVVKSFGFDTADTQLMTIPPFVFATLVLLCTTYWSDRTGIRSPFIIFSLMLNVIGYSVLLSNIKWGGHYVGIYLVLAGGYSAFPVIVSWAGNNFAGHYKRCVALALHIGIGNFAGAIFSNVYRSQDAPRYAVGHGIAMMFTWLGIIATVINVVLYRKINKDRARIVAKGEDGEGLKLSGEEVRRLGDKSPTFRYNL
ncbi:MFS nicotinic acid transporter Tna1 [Sistotremastrum suecicum HHB10207 ss-3]|uniref:MFS nicotinic acid transporter Tna1 n=1 Tax=Sistotremastrum suecicum HHB10207 ss-3 TaxID=1314776 RepID=A0A166ACD5_9AGAM|nr:MFS nicotinic acid transporter Tna1 [Sistotremastrum suecicum HHB10207 ss-3]